MVITGRMICDHLGFVSQNAKQNTIKIFDLGPNRNHKAIKASAELLL